MQLRLIILFIFVFLGNLRAQKIEYMEERAYKLFSPNRVDTVYFICKPKIVKDEAKLYAQKYQMKNYSYRLHYRIIRPKRT